MNGSAFETLQQQTDELTGEDVASDARTVTGRDMAVGDASVEIKEINDTGVMTLRISWTNLAWVDSDQLSVTKPFSSDFEPEMAFTVAILEGDEMVSTTPESSSSIQATVT